MKQLRMVASSAAEPQKSEQTGPIVGRKCAWHFFSASFSNPPSVQQALNSAMINRNETQWEAIAGSSSTEAIQLNEIRLINNIVVETSGFDAWLIGRQCVFVSGLGYL